jgi:hypothetical protein
MDRRGRGNSYDRRARRAFIKAKFGLKGGYVPCHWCKRKFRKNWEIDRWPICGHEGGSYCRDNIVPACRKCNGGRCSKCPTDGKILGHFNKKRWHRIKSAAEMEYEWLEKRGYSIEPNLTSQLKQVDI